MDHSKENLDPVIQKQLEFVEWLKEKGLYDPMASATTMQKMYAVWELAQRDTRTIEAAALREAAAHCKANYKNRFGNIVKGISYNSLVKLARRLENGASHD
jgi:hypothetical protein